jgi:hypothetical protein
MNTQAISQAVRRFVQRHNTTLQSLANRQTQLLEIASTVGVVQHYQVAGYNVQIRNPTGVSGFRVKVSTRGHPCDYSRVICDRDGDCFEIHTNVSVRGAHDDGIYCVDVAMVKEGAIPHKRPKTKWLAIPNRALVSFAEAKKLVVYPMLLAQFVGIVHEIKPEFLGRRFRRFGPKGHLPPCLIALGQLSGNSSTIIDGFSRRRFQVLVAANYDFRLSKAKNSATVSPFYGDTSDDP